MAQNGFYINLDKCSDCKRCEIACSDWNNVEVAEYDLPDRAANPDRDSPPAVDAMWMGYLYREEGTFPDVTISRMPLPCFQCENPVCRDAAPEGALYKREEDGTVFVDQSKLNEEQSQAVAEACPFDRIQIPSVDMPASSGYPDGKSAGLASKCVACFDREGDPACVEVCHTGALDYGDMDELREEYPNASREPLKEPFSETAVDKTKPAVIIEGDCKCVTPDETA